MKITRSQLRQLINEAMHEGKYVIVDPKGVATPASDAYMTGISKDKAVSALDPKINSLMQQGGSLRQMARTLASSVSLEDENLRPDPMTSAEETAVDNIGKERSEIPDDDVEYVLEGQMVFNAIKNKSINVLKALNVEFNDTAMKYYPGLASEMNEEATLLGCHSDETAQFSRDSTDSNALARASYHAITDYLNNKKKSGEATFSMHAARDQEAVYITHHLVVLHGGVKFLYSAYDDYDIIKFCVR